MSFLERVAVERVLSQAREAGVPIPPALSNAHAMFSFSAPARAFAEAHPDFENSGEYVPCCMSSAIYGLERCTCWEPVYDVDQAPPRPPKCPADLAARPSMCSDCAFKPGSPERDGSFMEETLRSLPERGDAFWCHDGMRRPVKWVHVPEDGGTSLGEIPGDPDDWHPATAGNVPFRADGQPAMLCAGWLALRLKTLSHAYDDEPEPEVDEQLVTNVRVRDGLL